jgi:carboxypeptidase T
MDYYLYYLHLQKINSMKKITLLLVFLIYSLITNAQQVKYSRAKIYLDSKEKTLKNLAGYGLAVDHGQCKKDTYFISDFSEREINIAKAKGYQVEIIIDDVSDYYSKQNKDKPVKKNESPQKVNRSNANCNSGGSTVVIPSDFQLGSMGGYYTYTELQNILDSMSAKFPNLITVKQPIDAFLTNEGRPIYWLKISDNPNVNESEPQIIYTGLHHAREPESITQMIFYMYYLLENYNSNPEIKALVDNTELYFVPCLNPDGYIYNETTNPGGGGMWRKNRRDNQDGTFGVDLNRNYGYNWGYDDIGSSPSSVDDTYRGPTPFSEPETQAIQWFDAQHHFKMALNYHTYGNDLIYPWGYQLSFYTPDSAVFKEHTNLMTSINHFIAGTGDQTVQYVTNGDADDWGYGEQVTKPKILSMTPEVGDPNEGFWPPQTSIIPMCINSLSQNIYGAELIGKYAILKDQSASAVSHINGFFDYSIQRLGLDSPAVYTASIIPLDAWIASVAAPKAYSSMSLLEVKLDSIAYTLNPAITAGQVFSYILRVNNGYYTKDDTISKIFGYNASLYSNDGSSILDFTPSADWGITTNQFVSAPSSITDSPFSNYADNMTSAITLNTSIDLTTAISASLNFWTKWEIESGFDYVEVLASIDGGFSWTPLCGRYTKLGNINQDFGKPLYDGFEANWLAEEMSLNDYLGQTVLINFQIVSDPGANYDGFYFDDLSVTTVSSSTGIKTIKGLDDNMVLQNIPNPANAHTTIHFNLTDVKNKTFYIYNMMGQLISQETISYKQSSSIIDISSFANGTYFYQVIGQNFKSKMMKMVVLK